MMKSFLTEAEHKKIREQHRAEKDRRTADRMKAVMLADKGWSFRRIAEALFLDEETISKHISEYQETEKLRIQTGGSKSKLNSDQTKLKQAEFIKEYDNLLTTTPENEPILFLDAVHPTIATKVTYGWIKKGQDKLIETTASRTRMNLLGSVNLETMRVDVKDYKTIDSEAMVDYFGFLRGKYPNSPKIHVILDRGSYNMSQKTKKEAKKQGIVLHHLPPYSPNLNPIERLWKVMNEYARNNHFFKSAQDFRDAILNFFHHTWGLISEAMVDRINDNFQTLKKSKVSV
jgi:transposase